MANSSLRTSTPFYRSVRWREQPSNSSAGSCRRHTKTSAGVSTVSPTMHSSGSRSRDAGPCVAGMTGAGRSIIPEPPHPDPAPFTTIGWRLVHVAECKVMYHEYAFGEAKLTFPEIDSAHTAAAAIAQLEAGHAMLVRDLAGLDDAGLEKLVLTNWGERWPARRIFWTMISHDAHHGAEIGALRHLYRERVPRGR